MKVSRLNGYDTKIGYTNNYCSYPVSKNLTEKSNNGIPCNSLEEAIGRSQVNFAGKVTEDSFFLQLHDQTLLKLIGKVYKLDKEKAEAVEDFTKEFLKSEKKESIIDFYSHDPCEYANEVAYYQEQLGLKLGLTEDECDDLAFIIDMHILQRGKENYNMMYNKHRYSMDFTPYKSVMEKNGVAEDDIYDIFKDLSEISLLSEQDSVFDIFSPQNLKENGVGVLEVAQELFKDYDDETIGNIILDLSSMVEKTREERLEGINIHENQELFEAGTNSIVIANIISNKYGIELTDDLIKMLYDRVPDKKNNCPGKSIKEIAFNIADKYNLPVGADKEIVAIIEKYDTSIMSEEAIQSLIDAFNKGS